MSSIMLLYYFYNLFCEIIHPNYPDLIYSNKSEPPSFMIQILRSTLLKYLHNPVYK